MTPEMLENESVAASMRSATDWLQREVSAALPRMFDAEDDHQSYGSPIEAIFAVWWEAARMESSLYGLDPNLELISQVEVVAGGHTYRLDFAVRGIDVDQLLLAKEARIPEPLLAIELDGHDFHERTKEQVTDRNRRDRDLQAAGWKVLHVSGSELYRDPRGVVDAILRIVVPAWSQFRRDVIAHEQKLDAQSVSQA